MLRINLLSGDHSWSSALKLRFITTRLPNCTNKGSSIQIHNFTKDDLTYWHSKPQSEFLLAKHTGTISHSPLLIRIPQINSALTLHGACDAI